LFGTAVQTGVVMVIYLEEAVERKRAELGGHLTRAALQEAVVEGALLRLRPKVMTVSTVVAGLLPIMWSTRVGAEVMKPLATPVLGGMISSLVHVLVVTPVIFFWIRERRLGLQDQPLHTSRPSRFGWRPVVSAAALVAIAGAGISGWRAYHARSDATAARGLTVIQEVAAGDMRILLLSATGPLKQGRNAYTIEFRSRDGSLVDVGTVGATGNMPMPGMVMPGGIELQRTAVAGRYEATAEFGMAGNWQMAFEWDGPAGHGSVNFEGAVQ
jgi:Cu(I)/Ag(I) efflux system membrane protein CusA/SilA